MTHHVTRSQNHVTVMWRHSHCNHDVLFNCDTCYLNICFSTREKIKNIIFFFKKIVFDYLKINFNLFRPSILYITRCHFNKNIYPGFVRKLPVIEIDVFRLYIRLCCLIYMVDKKWSYKVSYRVSWNRFTWPLGVKNKISPVEELSGREF